MQYLHSKIFILAFVSALLTLSSCDRKRYFEENTAIPADTWKSNNKVPFSVDIKDTLARYNICINLRNDLDYGYSNIFLFLRTKFPDGQFAVDTIECTLAGPDGKWLGTGMGKVRFNRFMFQRNVMFRHAGTYVFTFEQAMRVNDLKGISDIGLRIEKE